MADTRLLDALFSRPEIAEAEERLRVLVRDAAGTTRIGATHILRDRYRYETDPRHHVTRWG